MRFFELKIFALLVFVFLGAPTANAESAKMFKLTANGDLSKVTGYNWSNRWTQIVPFSARGENLLLFYDRDRGLAKLFSYNHAGGLVRKKAYSGWSKDWDHVIGGQFGEANMIFYNRVNGRLKAFRISETGSMSLQFQQTIENPVGASLISVSNPPRGPGWDIVTPGRWSWVGGRTVPGLLFYNRTEGKALFLRYDEAEGRFVFAHRYYGWNNSWDEIKAADFNGDWVDDLVLYDQDGGKLKVIYMNEDYSFDSHLFLKDRDRVFAGRTHFPQLVIGKFGGGRGKNDILLYQQDKCPNGQDCVMDDHGRGLLWTDNRRSGWNLNPKVYSNWSDDWTHVIPVKTNPTYYGSTGLLFYRNQVTLKLVIWRVEDPVTKDDTKPASFYQWSPTQRAQLDQWIEVTRNTFKAAGIKFDVTVKDGENTIWGVGMERKDTTVTAPKLPDCSVAKTNAATYVRTEMLPTDSIHAFVVPSTNGCPGVFWGKRLLFAGQGNLNNPKHLSHEVAHYLGLPHTFPFNEDEIKASCKSSYAECVSAMAELLADKKTALGRDVRFADLDVDWMKVPANPGSTQAVYDTPPVLNKIITQHLRETTVNVRVPTSASGGFPGNCKPGARYTFNYPFSGSVGSRSNIEMYQESHNVASYTNCDGLFRISKDQVRVIRQRLFRTDPGYGWARQLIGN
jgi:hypothetical protein